MKFTPAQLIITLVLIVIVAVGAYFGAIGLNKDDSPKERQAVFLTNGQVYFGYVKNEKSDPMVITDVYYLQVQQALQADGTASASQADQQVSLVKLGNELHGPKDEMRINREQILFVEDMKADSKVNESIADYVKNGAAAATTATPTPAAITATPTPAATATPKTTR